MLYPFNQRLLVWETRVGQRLSHTQPLGTLASMTFEPELSKKMMAPRTISCSVWREPSLGAFSPIPCGFGAPASRIHIAPDHANQGAPRTGGVEWSHGLAKYRSLLQKSLGQARP
ncbi:hypothetical protein AGR9A_Lc40139 [Agrobacterium salinitolerans str. Hayward 0363]|nr:hypothetical protein AGR9A_Lc40139 [Agrobacterium salinitolerans str. Hayward 0363]